MRTGTGATGIVASASVAVAALGHALAGGGPVSVDLIVPLAAFAGLCWPVSELLGRQYAVPLLAAIQLVVHHALGRGHPQLAAEGATAHGGHSHTLYMSGTEPTVARSLDPYTMTAAHLAVLLAGMLVVGQAHRWVQRVVAILARLVPAVPTAPCLVPGFAAPPAFREHRPVPRSRPVSAVRRRGPPQPLVRLVLS